MISKLSLSIEHRLKISQLRLPLDLHPLPGLVQGLAVDPYDGAFAELSLLLLLLLDQLADARSHVFPEFLLALVDDIDKALLHVYDLSLCLFLDLPAQRLHFLHFVADPFVFLLGPSLLLTVHPFVPQKHLLHMLQWRLPLHHSQLDLEQGHADACFYLADQHHAAGGLAETDVDGGASAAETVGDGGERVVVPGELRVYVSPPQLPVEHCVGSVQENARENELRVEGVGAGLELGEDADGERERLTDLLNDHHCLAHGLVNSD